MRRVTYSAPNGHQYIVVIPEGVPESHAAWGIRVGPPDLSSLMLSPKTEQRLNHELFRRGLITVADIQARPGDVVAAVQAAYKADALAVIALYEQR